MDKKLILVCDDDNRVAESLAKSISTIDIVQRDFKIEASEGKFELAIRALEERLRKARSEISDSYPDDDATIIDETSILVIDYDLIAMDASITGERAAYLARCYSRCGLIVGLNQFPPYVDEYFDLSLKGHPESYADLNISSKSLGNPGLWQEPWEGFRPWHWPLLPSNLYGLEGCVTALNGHLDKPIFEFFGFQNVSSLSLPRSMIEYITKFPDPMKTTFRDFVINSGNGLRRKDEPFSDEAIVRIAVARLRNWFENIIFPGLDIIVDAPHLVSRYPSLLQGDPNDVDLLNGTAVLSPLDHIRLAPVIESFQFRSVDWLSRPVWFWGDISNCADIPDVSNPWSVQRSDYVFCEDVSRFLPKDQGKGFLADLNSPFVRRYIRLIDGINYIPRVRLSL